VSDDPPPPAHRICRDVGIPSGQLGSVASDHPATVETAIRLSEVADQAGLSVEDRIALRTQFLREWVAGGIMVLFVAANVVTLIVVERLVRLDQSNIAGHLITPADRIITNQVVMALLGATAVQVGAIAVIIARYLFPGRQP
jgi:hypothetical protein